MQAALGLSQLDKLDGFVAGAQGELRLPDEAARRHRGPHPAASPHRTRTRRGSASRSRSIPSTPWIARNSCGSSTSARSAPDCMFAGNLLQAAGLPQRRLPDRRRPDEHRHRHEPHLLGRRLPGTDRADARLHRRLHPRVRRQGQGLGMHYLVTGHTGFKGAWLTLMLANAGHRVSGIALDPVDGACYDVARVGELVEHDVRLDIRDAEGRPHRASRNQARRRHPHGGTALGARVLRESPLDDGDQCHGDLQCPRGGRGLLRRSRRR